MKRLIAILLPILVLGSLITWRVLTKRAEATGLAQQRQARANVVPQVAVTTADLRSIKSTFEATGTLESPLNVKISPKVSGRVELVAVHEGDRVSRGQVLVRIDDSQIEADVREQQAQLAQAQYRLAQALTAEGPTNVGIKTQISQQAAGVTRARAGHEQARQNLRLQVASAQASVEDAQGRVENALAAIGNAKAGITSAQAVLDNARTRLKRVEELNKRGYVATQEVDEARTQVAVEEAGLQEAEGRLRSAQAAHSSAFAQKRVAEQQVAIVQAKTNADLEAAKADTLKAEAALDYAKSNTAQSPAYRQGIAALKAAVAAEQAALASTQARRADTVLKCPTDGYVTTRYMDPGSVANAGQPILEVQFFRQIWVSFSAPDDINSCLSCSQQAQVKFDAFPGRVFLARIIQINPSANAQARQFVVRAVLNNEQRLLRPGMFAHVKLTTADSGVMVTIPREALQQDPEGSFVHVVDAENKVTRRAVTPGPSEAEFLAISEGLNAGENVVTLSSFTLKEGQTVRTGPGREAGKPAGARPGAGTSERAPSSS
ncbi:MAG: efflux RND transporter periplasmic adaptor subunit [Armatimonadota bacterium]